MNYQPEPSLLNTPLNQMCARILSQSVRANYFYFFSAALMLCASYLLISSQALDGSAFVRTCKAWAILQGYEVLLIATAAWIVRRLKIMDDAFSLLLVELVLLLDPTFFSNSFSTQLNAPGMWVDVLCFAFAGIKCVFLMRLLHLRLLPQMWGALLFAFVAVYLLEVPLNKPYAFKTLEPKEYSFLLVWGPMVYACLCPALGKMFSVTTEDATYLPQDRQTFLNRLLLGLPLLIIVCHDMESLRVHEIIRSTPHLAPLFMAAAVVLLRNTPAAESARRIGWVDVCCVLALVCSYAHPDYEENCPKPFNPEALTGWMKTFPVLLAGACTLGLYAWIYARCRTRQVLYRLGGIGVVLILWLVFRSGAVWAEIKLDYLAIEGMLGAICQSIMGWGIWRGLRIALVGALNVFSWTVSCVLNASGSGIAWLYEHPAIVLWVFAMVLGGLLLRYRKNGILWTTFGWLMLWNLFHLTPANWGGLQWEMVQAVIVYGLVMDHLFQNSARGNRYVFVAIVAGIALLRFIGSPGWGTGCVIALEAVALFLFGIKLRYFGYLVVSVGQIVLAALYGCHLAHFKLDAALSVLIVALAFFGLAVCITFFKKQISAWLEKFFGEMKPLSF
ncbi:TPA: hypothetical protein DDW35_12400, partial [Candidatus Sumerlaeota bacterium]|nr:hypothetical protein [Candidatus Sumerlaeota bacterium]